MLEGGGALPPLRAIHVSFVGRPVVAGDPRPGKDARWHRIVRTGVVLAATAIRDGRPLERLVRGDATFYVVRGDSARVPRELVARGFRPDSAR